MSRENVEIVRRAWEYEIQGRGGRAEALEIFDPDVVMYPVDDGPFYGVDAMRDDIERWTAVWDEHEAVAEAFIDGGDHVLVTAYMRGRGRASGVEVEARFYEIYTLREGKVVRIEEFSERDKALEAAGLSE